MKVKTTTIITVTKEEKAFLDNLNSIIDTEICEQYKDCVGCPFYQPAKEACSHRKFFPGLYSIIDVE